MARSLCLIDKIFEKKSELVNMLAGKAKFKFNPDEIEKYLMEI